MKKEINNLYLIFSLADRLYGISVSNLTEIIGYQPVSPLTDVPAYVKGVINLRGRIIPAIDMRTRLGIEEMQYNERICMLIITVNGRTVSLIVDSVQEILRISADRMEIPPVKEEMENTSILRSMTDFQGAVIMIINLENFEEEIVFSSHREKNLPAI